MSDLAIILAGGQGTRMSRSGAALPKPLVKVGGISLLERNLQQLVKHGFTRIRLAIPVGVPEFGDYLSGRLIPFATAAGVTLDVYEEVRPLGNFGAVQTLSEGSQPFAVVFADNITALDLRAVFDEHVSKSSAMTVCAHRESFILPYGELVLEDDVVCSYVEKPITSHLVCSAICVVNPEAAATIGAGEVLGLSQFVTRLIGAGHVVRAFAHAAPWIDVNDLGRAEHAERLIRENLAAFGCWAKPEPLREGVLAVSPSFFGEIQADFDFYDSHHKAIRRWLVSSCAQKNSASVPAALRAQIDLLLGSAP